MSLRRLLLLAILCVAAGTYYYAVEVRGAAERAEQEAAEKTLFPFEPDRAARIRIARPAETIALAKRDGAWWVEEPVAERADETSVSSLLSTLSALEPDRSLEEHRELSEYGLDDPQLSILVEDDGGAALAQLAGGHESADKKQRYVHRVGSDTVDLIPTWRFEALSASLFDLRSKNWTALTPEDVRAIEIRDNAGLHVRVARAEGAAEGGAEWRILDDEPKRADAAQMRTLANRLLNARIAAVIAESSDEPETYGLAEPKWTVTFAGQGVETAVAVGDQVPAATPPQRYVRVANDPRILAFNAATFDVLPDEPSDLRDRALVRADAQDIVRVEIARDGGAITLERDPADPEAWIIGGAAAQPADPAEAEGLARAVAGLRIEEFPQLDATAADPANFAQPALRVAVWMDPAAAPVRLAFAQGGASNRWYARRADDPEVFAVSEAQVTALRVTEAQLADKRLLRFGADAVQRLAVQADNDRWTYSRLSDGTWRAGPGAPLLSDVEIAQFLQDLRELRYAERLPADTLSGDEAPRLGVTLLDAADGEMARLEVYERAAEGQTTGATRYVVAVGGAVAAVEGRSIQEWLELFQPDA